MIVNKFTDDPTMELMQLGADTLEDSVEAKIAQVIVTFSNTRTSQRRLAEIYKNCTTQADEMMGKQQWTYSKLCAITHLFTNYLESTNLYKDVKLVMLPGDRPNHVKLHYQIVDKQPFFMSISNEFDTNGALLTMKLGYKNFMKVEDTLQFEYEKTLNKRGMYWLLNWQYNTLDHIQYSFDLKQSHNQIQPQLEEKCNELSLKCKTGESEFQLSYAYRNNLIEQQDSLLGEFLYARHMNNLNFLPSQALIAKYTTTLHDSITSNNNIPSGSLAKTVLSVGIPKFTSYPFVKCHMTHQYNFPLKPYRKSIPQCETILKNSALQVSMNYGLIYGPHLMINDMFQGLNFRGFSQIVPIGSSKRIDTFAKLDLKCNVYNNEHLKKQNIQLFYYGSLFTVGQPKYLLSNLRASYGVGVALPIQQSIKLEALFSMGMRKKLFDTDPAFQIRLSMDD